LFSSNDLGNKKTTIHMDITLMVIMPIVATIVDITMIRDS
jgi:hypothetical protein